MCFLNFVINARARENGLGLSLEDFFKYIFNIYIYIYIYILNSYSIHNLLACNKLLLNAGHNNGYTFWPEQLYLPQANSLIIITG